MIIVYVVIRIACTVVAAGCSALMLSVTMVMAPISVAVVAAICTFKIIPIVVSVVAVHIFSLFYFSDVLVFATLFFSHVVA